MMMKRRAVLRQGIGCLLLGVAGCTSEPWSGDDDVDPVLTISPQISETGGSWELTARVENDYNWDVEIHNITVIAFNETGTEVCRADAGDLGHSRTVTLTCGTFPTIITATADESPCDGAKIDIYYWVGSDEERGSPNDISLWETTHRRCDESLPPKRVLEKVNATDEETDPS